MSKIEAKIVADSKNEFGNRITTMQVTFPRFILAELNTHRIFSKNSASSRAIPFEKMLKSVEENPFIPIAWQKDHKGMQGTEYFTNQEEINVCKSVWLKARNSAIDCSKGLNFDWTTFGGHDSVTKQLCNRLLEPFMWHTVLITATEWENFFALRCPKYRIYESPTPKDFRSKKDFIVAYEKDNGDCSNATEMFWQERNKGQAEIHMMALAEAMWDAMNESTPKELKAGEWHIPFGDGIEWTEKNWTDELSCLQPLEDGKTDRGTTAKIKIATARCARVSYTVVGEEGKEANYENDIKLHDRLAESGHWSPFEHCARAMDLRFDIEDRTFPNEWSGNFKGFIQYRKTFNNENIK